MKTGRGTVSGWLGILSLVAASLSFVQAASAAAYGVQPVPAWVTPVPVQADAAPGKISGGVEYLLVDSQTRITAQTRQTYRHQARRAVSDKGLGAVGNLSIEFDPSYQTLNLHALVVHREGRAVSRLERARIKVLERETGLEQGIYRGSKTVAIALEDVRSGDVVEYAYSLSGWNPVFRGLHFGQFDLQWGVPITQLRARLLVPADRPMFLRAHNDTAAPVKREFDKQLEYLWVRNAVRATAYESGAPDWFDPAASVEWSQFKDWGDVARWAEPLYAPPGQLDAGLRAALTRIEKQHATPPERLRAVLQFVQEQIRYLAVSIGPGSHAPRPPQQVLRQRFGDCKDKTLLTLTLLRALGIEASAALVDTESRRAVAESLPSPGAFNHVLIKATVEGQDYWLDPTRESQKAELAQLSQSDHGFALVLDGKSSALAAMPNSEGRVARRKMEVLFDFSQGIAVPAVYRVKTLHQGAAAEAMRRTLARDELEDLQRSYLNFYARSFPGIEVAAPMEVVDDEQRNRVDITEHYRVRDLWKRSDKQAGGEAVLDAPDMRSLLIRPDDKVRLQPLAVNHPQELELIVEARMPPAWGSTPRARQSFISNAAFEYEQSSEKREQSLWVRHHYRSLADHVLPKDLAAYADDLAAARRRVGHTVAWLDGETTRPMPSWWPGAMALLASFGLNGMVPIARKLRRALFNAQLLQGPGFFALGCWVLIGFGWLGLLIFSATELLRCYGHWATHLEFDVVAGVGIGFLTGRLTFAVACAAATGLLVKLIEWSPSPERFARWACTLLLIDVARETDTAEPSALPPSPRGVTKTAAN